MAESNSTNETVGALLKGMESYLTTKTVVGEAIESNGMTLLPLCDVSFGVGAGAWNGDNKNNGAGAMGGKIVPTAVLVLQNGTARMVSVTEDDKFSKIMNMVPDVVNRFFKKEDSSEQEAEPDSSEKAE